MLSLRPVAQDSTRPRRGRKPKTSESIASETSVSPKQPRNSLATGILTNLSRFSHCILLTRVGQFYEVRTAQDASHRVNTCPLVIL